MVLDLNEDFCYLNLENMNKKSVRDLVITEMNKITKREKINIFLHFYEAVRLIDEMDYKNEKIEALEQEKKSLDTKYIGVRLAGMNRENEFQQLKEKFEEATAKLENVEKDQEKYEELTRENSKKEEEKKSLLKIISEKEGTFEELQKKYDILLEQNKAKEQKLMEFQENHNISLEKNKEIEKKYCELSEQNKELKEGLHEAEVNYNNISKEKKELESTIVDYEELKTKYLKLEEDNQEKDRKLEDMKALETQVTDLKEKCDSLNTKYKGLSEDCKKFKEETIKRNKQTCKEHVSSLKIYQHSLNQLIQNNEELKVASNRVETLLKEVEEKDALIESLRKDGENNIRKRKLSDDKKKCLRRFKRMRVELESLKSLGASTLREETETNRKITDELERVNETVANISTNTEEREETLAAMKLFEDRLKTPWFP